MYLHKCQQPAQGSKATKRWRESKCTHLRDEENKEKKQGAMENGLADKVGGVKQDVKTLGWQSLVWGRHLARRLRCLSGRPHLLSESLGLSTVLLWVPVSC